MASRANRALLAAAQSFLLDGRLEDLSASRELLRKTSLIFFWGCWDESEAWVSSAKVFSAEGDADKALPRRLMTMRGDGRLLVGCVGETEAAAEAEGVGLGEHLSFIMFLPVFDEASLELSLLWVRLRRLFGTLILMYLVGPPEELLLPLLVETAGETERSSSPIALRFLGEGGATLLEVEVESTLSASLLWSPSLALSKSAGRAMPRAWRRRRSGFMRPA